VQSDGRVKCAKAAQQARVPRALLARSVLAGVEGGSSVIAAPGGTLVSALSFGFRDGRIARTEAIRASQRLALGVREGTPRRQDHASRS
jgi:hypothetical protein